MLHIHHMNLMYCCNRTAIRLSN